MIILLRDVGIADHRAPRVLHFMKGFDCQWLFGVREGIVSARHALLSIYRARPLPALFSYIP